MEIAFFSFFSFLPPGFDLGTADFCVKHALECPAKYTQLNVEQLLCYYVK